MEAKRQGIDLSWKPPVNETCILGDAFRIKQVVFNLVDNAIKYNHPGGSVNITLHTENRSAIIQVADTGIGIAKDDLPQDFRPVFPGG